MITFSSKKKLDEQKQDFSLLPSEDYKLKIIDIQEEQQKKYQSEELEDVIKIKLEVVSYKDGEEAFDIDGKSATGRKIFFDARPESIGFQKDGTPSKTRALVAYALKQDIYGEIEFESWDQLTGKEVFVEVIQKENQKGVKQNRIARFIAPKDQRPQPIKEVKSEDIPIIEEEEMPEAKDMPF